MIHIIRGKPVPKGRPRATIKAGKVVLYTPTTTKKAEESIQKQLQNQETEKIKGLVGLQLHFFIYCSKEKQYIDCVRKRPDIDNLTKLVMDALKGILYEDDSQVAVIHASKTRVYTKEEERTLIVAYEV